ncbi:MAG: response regulator [Chromatiaceae bacterium]|nr:response regulator [Gammaproteobacteria bacterium]MCP5448244.1 response regulator [Chromatiaceae bacterium]
MGSAGLIHNHHARPVEILLVEDNPPDQDLTREAFKQGRLNNNLHVVDDGEQALAFLRREGEYGNAPRPGLILLDLNLPRMDGRELLKEIKGDAVLSSIPVVVLTTSNDEADVLKSYQLHANCYLTKPVEFDNFTNVVRSLEHFWLTVVQLPPVQ